MPASDAPTRPIGTLRSDTTGTHSGGTAYTAWYEQALEHVPDVTYPTSVETYHRMRRDPTLTSILAGYWHPIVRASWHVDPAGAPDEIVRDVADSLGLPIAGDDQPGAQRGRGVQWPAHVRLALLKLVYGHIGFEDYYDLSSGRAVLAGLPERMPYSIDALHVDDRTGEFLGITQKTAGRPAKDTPQIKADRLVWYAHEREGAAWWGTSLLRPAFGPWLLKQDALRVHGTALRRFGTATPVAEVQPGANPTPAEIQSAQRMMSAVRAGDTSGAAAPPGFTIAFKGVTGTMPSGIEFARYLDEQMARAALYSLLDLGNTSNGSRALGDNFADVLAMALQSVADDTAADATTQIAARIATFNGGEGVAVPRIVPGPVAANEEAITRTLAELMGAGALTHDPDLEAHVRRIVGLPQRSTTAPPPTPPVAAPPVAASRRPAPARPTPGRPPRVTAAAAEGEAGEGWPYRRALTATEVAAALDPAAIDQAEDDVTTAALNAWPAVIAAQRDQLLAQVEALLDAGNLEGLATLTVDARPAADVLAAAADDATTRGVALAGLEAADQGVTLPKTPDVPDLGPWARSIAASLASGLATAVGREALRLAGPGATTADVVAGVAAFIDGLGDTAVRETIGSVVQAGLNGGRTAAVAAGGDGARYFHSAVRDRSTCAACAAADGFEYPTLTEAEAAFPTGGYRDCEGRFKCRCVIAVTWS